MTRYRIVRMRKDNPPSRSGLPKGLTLEEAREWCRRESTHKKDKDGNVIWFDGYEVDN